MSIRPALRLSLMSAIAAACCVLAATAAQAADPAPPLPATGLDGAGQLLAFGSVDTHYTVSGPGGTDAPVFAVDGALGYPGYWMAPGPRSAWISPLAAGSTGGNVDAGVYTYTTWLDLSGFAPAGGRISGGIAVDNTLVAIRLNGSDAALPSGSVSYGSLQPFTIEAGFVSGLNRLDFVVYNEGGPSGLRVEMTPEFVAAPVPEPATALTLLAGLAALGGLRRAGRR